MIQAPLGSWGASLIVTGASEVASTMSSRTIEVLWRTGGGGRQVSVHVTMRNDTALLVPAAGTPALHLRLMH